MCLTVGPREDLVQGLAPAGKRKKINPTLSGLSSEHRAKKIPPKQRCLVADIDATFEQQIFDLTEPNPNSTAIIAVLPQKSTAVGATDLDFQAERSFKDSITVHTEGEPQRTLV